MKVKKAILCLIAVSIVLVAFNGCAKKDEDVIKIGVILPLTGDAAVYGQNGKNAIKLAVKNVNENGGVRGTPVQIIYEDTKAETKTGVNALQKLINVDNVNIVIGAVASSVTLAVAPIAEQNKVVLLSPGSSSPKIRDAGDYIFRNVTSDDYDGMVLADYCYNELGIRNCAVIDINNDFGVGLCNAFSERYEKVGGKIVLSEQFKQGETKFQTQIQKLKTKMPEAVFFVGYKEAMNFFRQCKELGFTTQFLSVGIIEDRELYESVGDYMDGLIYTFRSFDPKSEDIIVKNFVEQYNATYATYPDLFAAYAFDAANILFTALENAKSLNVDDVKKELLMLKYDGVTGHTEFDEYGDVLQPLGIKKIMNNTFVWIEKSYSLK